MRVATRRRNARSCVTKSSVVPRSMRNSSIHSIGVDVEVVGRLVEQQHVGLPHERAREQRLALAPARRGGERRVGVEAEVLEHRLDARLHLPRVGGVERVMQAVELAQRGVARVGRRRGGSPRGTRASSRPASPSPAATTSKIVPSTSSGTSCSSRATVTPVWRTTSPLSGCIVPSSSFMSVLLPAPLRPSRQTRSPRSMAKSAPSRIGGPPNAIVHVLHCEQGHYMRAATARRTAGIRQRQSACRMRRRPRASRCA